MTNSNEKDYECKCKKKDCILCGVSELLKNIEAAIEWNSNEEEGKES
jgi:hypothetical protein